jgi:hypothetical protein
MENMEDFLELFILMYHRNKQILVFYHMLIIVNLNAVLGFNFSNTKERQRTLKHPTKSKIV